MKRLLLGHSSKRWASVLRHNYNYSLHLRAVQCGCGTQCRSISTTQEMASKVYASPVTTAVNEQLSSKIHIVDYIESIQETGKIAVLFSDSPPVLMTVEILCAMKDLPGMSWVGVVFCGTFLIRSLVGLPIAVIQQKSVAKLESLKPEFQKLGNDLKMETAMAVKKFGWDQKTARIRFTRSYKKHWRRIVEENNCHPMRSLALTLLQLPFWITFSSALRNIVYAVPLPRTPEMTERWYQIYTEGTPWVESLVMSDPLVFPLVFFTANMVNIEMSRRQRRMNLVPETKIQKILPWVLRGGIVVITYFAATVPSAVSMYWATSSTFALAQNVFLSSQTGKRIFKIPMIQQQPQTSLGAVNKSL
ncbi:Mitochondrial inner membrane protein COX18 [Orchesella cincta]|uniref:Mitochondrial inner membrane protein COX18 n=1 Tax=Orchesella cincta TaxID=48709 RepID=A0A1D2MP75_ORCCI|nr:Mitochondrial inner membrane protein COX18 [Orchesella cincta]